MYDKVCLSRGVYEANVKPGLKSVSINLDLRTLNLSLVHVSSLMGLMCGIQRSQGEAKPAVAELYRHVARFEALNLILTERRTGFYSAKRFQLMCIQPRRECGSDEP